MRITVIFILLLLGYPGVAVFFSGEELLFAEEATVSLTESSSAIPKSSRREKRLKRRKKDTHKDTRIDKTTVQLTAPQETDPDKDGIFAPFDLCPDLPEDFDGFEDTDGCPDLDNDGDGIPDLLDACPDLKGTEDNSGCPSDPTLLFTPSHILSGVQFRSGEASIPEASFVYIAPLVCQLEEDPSLTIEIYGHTDSSGEYKLNLTISQKRADAIRNHLIKKGIAKNRIQAIGVGPNKAIADNRTISGRAINRRIEFFWHQTPSDTLKDTLSF